MFKMKNLICIVVAIAICASMTCGAFYYSGAFEDVKEYDDLWYYDAVEFCYKKGIMKGTTTNEFSPNGEVTRGMFVTILYRYEGEPEITKETAFTDITKEDYYYNAVNWAAENQLVFGMDETTFAPDKAISREDMACLIVRYLDFKDIELPHINVCECVFEDFGDISEYAVDSTTYMKNSGLMVGDENEYFHPKKSTTRAEVATLFTRLLIKIEVPARATIEIDGIDSEKGVTTLLTTDETTEFLNIISQLEFRPTLYAEYVWTHDIITENVIYRLCYTKDFHERHINYILRHGGRPGGTVTDVPQELWDEIVDILKNYESTWALPTPELE